MFLLIYGILPIIGEGPIYYTAENLQTNCRKHFWQNLLFINAYQKTTDMCVSWTWYISDDMQFYLVGIVLSIVFAYSKVASLISSFALLLGSLIGQFVVFYTKKLTVAPSNSEKQIELFDSLYFPAWARIPTYLVGMLFGWLYLANKD